MNWAKLSAIFNPEDMVALEVALQIKDKYGREIKVIAMGPPKASDGLHQCLYMRKEAVHLVRDGKFVGADILATSHVISEAMSLAIFQG